MIKKQIKYHKRVKKGVFSITTMKLKVESNISESSFMTILKSIYIMIIITNKLFQKEKGRKLNYCKLYI